MDLALYDLLSFLLLLLLLPYSTIAQTSKNQSLGSSLTAQKENSYWASPSGDFAFGFQQVGNGGYLLAIWFNILPEKTIVWSANGNDLVPSGSKVELTKDGQFLLNDPTGNEIWKAALVGTGVAYAAMLDSGNFVLASQDSGFLWQSFDNPTDTILPTQTMEKGSKLVARYSEGNYSNGRFQFTLQMGGNLVLETRALPLDSPNSDYWSSGTVGNGFEVVFNQSGFIYLTDINGSILQTITSSAGSTQDFYQRAVMEYDGVFIHYVYPKNSTNTNIAGRWPMAWSNLPLIPPNMCLLTEDMGSGACGFNSYCKLGNDQRPTCLCPDGYSFIDPNDIMKGCKQNFQPQSCDIANPETDQFDLINMPNVNWPLFDYAHFQGQTEDWCRKACLDDCFCAVVIFGAGQCWKKKIPLSNGRHYQDPTAEGNSLIKIRKYNSTLQCSGTGADSKKKDRSTLILIVLVLLSSSVFLNLFFMLAAFLFGFRFKYWKPNVLQVYPAMPGMNLRSFTYEELRKATNGFKEELGSELMVREGQDLEFNAEEIHLIHQSILLKRLNWYQRIQIALGTARGLWLFHLHEECSSQIIHCDIKPQNILLDDSFTARISDFGLAKLLKTDQTRTTTGIRGTKGYVAPEWFRSMPVTVKVDVYSFGILLLELICCRKNFDAKEQEDLMILADWAYDCFKDMKLELLVANDEEAIHDMKRVEKYVMIAIWCIQEDPSIRPTMKKVVQMMEGAVEVSVPPTPSSFISSI
uniref:Receptor-like serine/threonine-protein kinase n=1 Tax=Fagus sylvatica TaxID=28930 RepID=A0A2N9J8L1_FAGSY